MSDDNTSIQDGPEEEPQLPEGDIKDRTREEFDKLKQSNKELKQENEDLKRDTRNILESLRPEPMPQPEQPRQAAPQPQAPNANNYSHLNQNQVNQITQQIIDDNGYLNEQALMNELNKSNQALQEADRRVKLAEEKAEKAAQSAQAAVTSMQDFQESQQMQAVHKKYPALDPKSEGFDPNFYDAVRNELVSSMIANKKFTVMDSADKWAKMFTKQEAPKDPQQRAKEQLSTQMPRRQTSNQSMIDHGELVTRTMHGDPNALAERLRRIGQ